MIVVNTTFRAALWADALFAIDANWWERYIEEVRRDFLGATYSSNDFHGLVGVVPKPFKAFGNSGAGAIALAAKAGASRVLMLGYDGRAAGARVHWHGDHPAGLGNAGSMPKWDGQFRELRDSLARLQIVNASRATALEMFPRVDLARALEAVT